MPRITFAPIPIVALLCAVPAAAQTAAPAAKPATLTFADIGRPKAWRPGGARLLYVKDAKEQWYRVDLLEPCLDLYPGQDPTFVTSTSVETQKRFSAVDIAHHQCTVTNLAKMDAPPPAEPYVPPPKAAPATPAK